ncbi:hypothetical protein [Nannocystis sp.]|uniref:hypothetical protein n=1 Tax=Nannocystis sp. TaxID=1962667 RepID=UPI0024296218|nr:hypothetical protein [Nannocystis sp.]MBK7827550.1 hypothetical protein [Nannocystis sp.]MBK9756430.1 hypothetical protein [Nannocystis sp.]
MEPHPLKRQMRDTAAPMPKQESVDQEPARRPQDWTAEQKLEAVRAEVVVLGAGGPVDPRERGRHSLGCRRLLERFGY